MMAHVRRLIVVKYELSEEEVQFIEMYRDLHPEFQAALEKQAKILFELQIEIVKELTSDD